MNIIHNENYIIINNHITKFSQKEIILFDLDNTLIKFNLKSDTYEYIYPIIPYKLKELSVTNNIVIISNQKQLKKKSMYDIFIKKIEKFMADLNNIHVEIYISICDGIYRKPNVGLYELMRKKYINNVLYYCGDALGRKGDFNDTDLKFALNLSIKIKSPEEVFLNYSIQNKIIRYPILNKKYYKFEYTPKKKEMIILVGFPGSGKSTISNMIFEDAFCKDIYYKIINRDTLKTLKKCIDLSKNCILNNMSLIIDNTNPSKETRKIFIDIAKQYNYTVKVIIINTSYLESLHRNYYRHIQYKTPLIPEIAYRIFKSKYELPNLNEGIQSITIMGTNIYDINYFKYYF